MLLSVYCTGETVDFVVCYRISICVAMQLCVHCGLENLQDINDSEYLPHCQNCQNRTKIERPSERS